MTPHAAPRNPPLAQKPSRRRIFGLRRVAVLAMTAALAAACSIEPDTTITASSDPVPGGAAGGLGDDAQTPESTAPAGTGDPTGPVGQTDDPQPGTSSDGDPQPGGEQPGPQSPAEGPGTASPDQPAGPVAETEAGDGEELLIPGDDVPFWWLVTGRAVRDDDGNITYPGGEYGGFWWTPDSIWQAVLNETFDLCDDNQAHAAVIGRRLGPGEEISPTFQETISSFRLGHGVTCEPGGRRYAYVTEGGPGPLGTSPQDAIEQLGNIANTPVPESFTGPPGSALGYKGHFYHIDTPAEEVAVLPESVTITDGTIRGLIQNRSRTQWARNATVTAGGRQWAWPLTIQPEEAAPFQIDGWTGTTDPAAIDLQITADLSPDVDISRALGFVVINGWYGTWSEYLKQKFPTTAVPEPPDGAFTYIEAVMEVRVPTSHPHLAHQINNLIINDLRVYIAFLQDPGTGTGPPVKVTDITQITPYHYIYETPIKSYEITRLPNTREPYQPYNFLIGFAEHASALIWIGGAQ